MEVEIRRCELYLPAKCDLVRKSQTEKRGRDTVEQEGVKVRFKIENYRRGRSVALGRFPEWAGHFGH